MKGSKRNMMREPTRWRKRYQIEEVVTVVKEIWVVVKFFREVRRARGKKGEKM